MLNEFGEETSGVLEGMKPGVRETPVAAGAFTRAAQRAAYDSAAESLLEEDEARVSEFVFSPTEEMRGRLEYARLDARARQMVADPDAFQDEEMGAVFKELNARRFVADERTMKAFDILDGVPEGGKANAARLDEFLKFTDALGAAKTTEEQQRMLDERFASDELKAWRAAETADGKTERETFRQYATEEEARAVAGFGGSAFSYEPEADAQGNVKHFVKQTHPVEYGSTANRAKIAREWLEKNGRQFGDKVASLRNFVGNPNDWLDSAFGGNPKGKGFGERLGERGVGTWLTDAQAIKEYERHVAGERMRAEAAKVMPFLTVQQKELVNLAASGADMDEFRGVFKLMNAEDREMMLSMVQAVRPEADLNWFTDSAYRVFSGVRGGLRGGGRAIQAGWSAIFDSQKEREKLAAEMLEDIHWAEAAGDLKLKDPTSFVEKALSGWSDSASLQFSMLGGEMLKRGGAAIPGWGGKVAVGAGYAMEAYGALSMIGEQFDNMLLNGIDIERAAPLAVCGGLIDAWVEKWNIEAYMGLKISPADMKRVGVRAALRASLKMDGKEFLKVMRTNAKQALTIAATECMEEMVQGWNREGWLGLAEGRGAIDSFASSKAYESAFDSLVEAIPACTAFGVFGAANVTGTVRKGAHGAYLEHLAGISSAVARRNGIDLMRKNGEAIAQRAALNEAARVAEATKGMTARERRAWINAQSEFTVSEKAFYNEHCEYVEASIAQTGREWTEARLSGSVNEAMWARSGWRFMHDDAGRITAVESKTGERWDVDAVNREAKLEDFTDERLAAFIAEWNEEVANGTLEGAKALPAAATRAEVEQWTAEDRERLADAVARVPGWYEGGKIRLFTGLADNATLGHELTHGFLDRLERVNNREARKAIRALKASFGAWWNEAAAHRVEDSIAADVLRYEEETAGGERVDARALVKNLVTAVRKAVGLGKGRAFLPVYRTAEGREISPDVAFGSVVAESLAAYAARMETERRAAEARRALREKHRAEREAKRQRKIQMRMAARGLAVDGAQTAAQAQGTAQTAAQAQGTAQTGAGVQTQSGNAQTQNNVSQTQTAAIPQSGLWRLGATGQFSGGGTQFSIKAGDDLSDSAKAEEFIEAMRRHPGATPPARLRKSDPQSAFAWFMENMNGKVFALGDREFRVNEGHFFRFVCETPGNGMRKGWVEKAKSPMEAREMLARGELSAGDIAGYVPARAASLPFALEVLSSPDAILRRPHNKTFKDTVIKKFATKTKTNDIAVFLLNDDGKTLGLVTVHQRKLNKGFLNGNNLVAISDEVVDNSLPEPAGEAFSSEGNAGDTPTEYGKNVPQPGGEVNGVDFSIMSREVDEEIAAEERAELEELDARFAGELAMLAEDGGAADGRTARAEEERLERAEERMREKRAEAVRTMPNLAEPNGAYGAAWRALTGGALEDADVAGLREEYGLSPEAVNLERGADGKWRLGGAGTQEEGARTRTRFSIANGPGFIDLERGDDFKRLEQKMLGRVDEEVQNDALGIKAKIGSKNNARHLVHKESVFGDENHEAHKYAVINALELFKNARTGIEHHDKKNSGNDYVRTFAPFYFGGDVYVATVTLRRDGKSDQIYSIEAVEVGMNAGDSPRSSRRTAQEAQSPDSLAQRLAYYVGKVNVTQPKFIGPEGEFSVSAAVDRIRADIAEFVKRHKISARELEGLERLRRDVGSARIEVADVVAATTEEAAEAVPNVAYDPVSNTFIEGRIVVDPSAAERVERGGERAPSVSPEEIMRSRGVRGTQFSIAGARRSVSEALARDENGHYKFSGGKGVRFADSLPILEFLGIRANGIFTIAERVRKMETKHFMTEEQIARLAEFCENPVAVFEGIDDMGGIVILTDELAPCAKGGPLKPIMVLLRPEKGGDGGFVASAYSRKPDKESAYVAMRSKLRFLDKNKVAGIRLEGETLSLLEPQASGNSVLTAEDYSSWKAMGNVPQSGGEVNGGVAAAPADPGKAGHFSIMGRSAERVATLYLAREMMENRGRIPDSRKIQALARRVGYNGSLGDLIAKAEAEAKTQTQLLRTIASDPKTEKALAAAGLSLRNERAIARARAAAIQFSREVSEGENQARRSMERAVRSVRGEDYETMLVREGLDMNAILLAIRPDERVKPEAAEGAEAEDADGDGGKSAEPRGPLSPEELKQVEEAARAAVERGAELVRQAREELAARSADAEGRKDTSAKDEEKAKPEAAETDDDGGEGAVEGGGADASGGLVAAAFRKAIAEAGLTLDNAEAMVQLVKAITEKYLRDFPGEVADFDAADVWASPIARAKFAANLASFAEAVAAAYAPSHARIRIARKAQLLDGKGLTTMRQIEEVGEELFRDLHRDVIRQSRAGLMREIKKLVKPHATRYAENSLNQDREGGVESSVGRYCKFAWKAMRMTAEQCEARADELANELSAWGAMGEDEASRYRDYADKKMELDMITMYGDLKSRMPSELAEIRDFLEQTINESKWEMMEFGRKWEETANEAIEAISGAIVGNPKDNGVRPEDEEVSGLYSLIGMLETKAIQLTRWCRDAAKRAASLKAFGAVEEMIQRAEDTQYNYMQREKAKMVDLCKRTYGSESAAAAALSADVDEAAAARLNRGTQNTKWTVGRLMQMYASCVQSDYADNCAAWGRDGEYVRLLEETLLGMNPNHIEFIKGLREIYLQQGDALNEVLVRTTGTRLLTPNRLYMPVKMFRDTNLGENIRARAYSPFAPSLTPRVKNGLDFDQSADIMDVWQQRMEDAAHTIAWADTGSLVQRICQSNRVLRAIRDSHGRKVMRQWNSYVLDMLAGAEQGKVDSADWGVRFMRTMASLAAKTWLMLNPASWAKQLAAVPCFALSRDGTLRQVTKSMGFLAMHPFEAAKVMRDLSGTEAFRARYGTAINQELKYATSNRGRFGTWLDKLTDMGMAGITKFDQLGVYCLAGVYHDKRCELETQGKTAEEASELASAWLMHIVDKTAQTTRAVNTSQLQRAGGAWGLLLQFKSGPAQQMQFEAAVVQDALANPSDAARWRKAAAVIAINHVIVPTINTAIEGLLLFFTSWGVPDDEKRQRLLELWIANAISGSFGSIVFLGTAIEGVTSLIGQAATGQKVNARDALGDSLPASGVVNLYLNSGNKAIRAFMEMTDGDIEEGAYEMAKAIGAVIPGLSWATRKGFQAWESYQEKK